jgi:diguanylate cyclase (GGDEF)-like protein/PAS domain S-box-containing protein
MVASSRGAPREFRSRAAEYPWGLAAVSASLVAAIYLILPEFAPSTLSGHHDVFLLGVCLGLAVGVVVRVPRRVIPVLAGVVALATFGQLVGDAVPSSAAVWVALVVGAELSALAILLRWHGIARLTRPVDVLLVGVVALVVALVCAVAAVFALTAAGALGAESVGHDIRSWALGDVFGVVCLAPAVFTARWPGTWSWNHAPEFAAAAGVTVGMTFFLFWGVNTPTPGLVGWPYLVMLGPLWIAVRLGVSAVAPVTALVMWFAAVGTVNGHGAFAAAAPLPHDRLAAVQIFAVIVASMLLLLGVLRDDRLRSLTRILASSVLLREVIDGMDAYVFAKSYADPEEPDGHYLLANQKWLAARHVDAADLAGLRPRDLFPAGAAEVFLANDRRVLEGNAPVEVQEPGVGPANESRIFLSSKFPLRDVDGQAYGVGGVVMDITDRVAAERALAVHTELLRAVLDNSRDGISRFDPQVRVEFVNQRAVELSGIPAEGWIGRSLGELGFADVEVANWTAHIASVFATGASDVFEYDVDNVEGRRWYEASLSPEFAADGSVAHVISTNRDITARREAEDELRHLATHDSLTTLANRTAIHDEIERSLRAGLRSAGSTAVLIIDLDRFQYINDSLGHDIGDELLREAGVRIAAAVRGGDLVGRMGGDEFCVVMRDLDDPAEAIRAAWRLVTDFRAAFLIGGEELFATASIGVAVAAGHACAQDLLREADTALFVAKGEGRDRVSVFNEDLRNTVTTRIRLEGELRHALELGQLAVWYQPEIDLTTGAMIAVEALLRWHHPSGETYTADRFVDLAEETGLILDIGPWVLNQACAQARAWATDRPDRHLTVRVNASALQLADAGLLTSLDQALVVSGLEAGLLCIEITETALLRETQTARDNLAGIRHRGVRIAVDDFGTGYASLAYLRQYPVDVLKIDRSFVSEITTDDYDRRLVAGIVSLAQTLGMTVTAEGVETPEQASALREMGCPGAQGYLYCRAVPADTITANLDTEYPHP